MKCQHCGSELSDNSKFCNICGQPIGEEEPKTSEKRRRTITQDKTRTSQRHRSEKKRRHAGEDDPRYETLTFDKPSAATDRRADWERAVSSNDKRYESLDFDRPSAPQSAAPDAGRADEINLNLSEGAQPQQPYASAQPYAYAAPAPAPENASARRFKKSQKKTTTLWISLIALLLIAAIVTGAVFIISRGKKKDDPSHESAAAPATEAIVFDAADEMKEDSALNAFLTTFINGTYDDTDSDSSDTAEQDDAKQQDEVLAQQEANAQAASVIEEGQQTAEQNEAQKEAEQNNAQKEARQETGQNSTSVAFDASAPADGVNILEAVVSDPNFAELSAGVYPFSYNELEYIYVSDLVPTEWGIDSEGSSYIVRSFKTSDVNRYCEQMFHLSQESIDAMYDTTYKNHTIWKNSTGEIYYALIPIDDTASSYSVNIKEVKTYDSLYYVTYDVTTSDGEPDTYYAVMKQENADGATYWTMYQNTAAVPSEDVPYVINNNE